MLQHYELFEYILREEQESEDIPLEVRFKIFLAIFPGAYYITYLLYKNIYLTRVNNSSTLFLAQLEVHLPPVSTSLCPAPLEEAVTEDFYSKCIVPPSISSATASEPLDIESKVT